MSGYLAIDKTSYPKAFTCCFFGSGRNRQCTLNRCIIVLVHADCLIQIIPMSVEAVHIFFTTENCVFSYEKFYWVVGDRIKQNQMGGACGTYGRQERYIQGLGCVI
jgi:hypothetical protein